MPYMRGGPCKRSAMLCETSPCGHVCGEVRLDLGLVLRPLTILLSLGGVCVEDGLSLTVQTRHELFGERVV